MEMVKLLIFFISTLVLPPDKATSQSYFSKCLHNETDSNITHLSTYGNWCYFVVDGSWNATNEPSGNDSYLFNISKAREICETEGATLPIIHNMEENKYISDHYHNLSTYLALGLKQHPVGSTYSYEWDDGSNLTVKPAKWENEENQTSFTIFKKEGWMNIAVISNHSVFVVCQQLLQSANVPETVCEYDNSSKMQFEETAIFENGNTKACYFVVNGSIDEANRKDNTTGRHFFDITVARGICSKYNATLPSIHSIAEESSLDIKKAYQFYAIGLKQVPVDGGYEYKWDDGSEFDYQPVWTSKYQPANYILSEYERHTGGPREWRNSLDQEAFFQEILVICKQSYPPKPKPPVRNISICNDPHKQNYSMTAVFRDQWCYFVIKEATNMSHMIISQNSYFFYPSTAREICKKQGATLPTIADAPEEKFVMENFKSDLFKVESGGISKITRNAEAILLGLNQMKHVSDYQWADGTPFSFESSDWTNKAQYALYTVMHLNQSSWMSLNNVAITAPIGVLCKKPHFHEPGLHSTPKPVTTSTQNTPSTPPPPPPLCDQDTTTRFPEIKTFKNFNNKTCYFIVDEADSAASKLIKNGSYTFNITRARQTCAQYNATLPSVHSIGEDEFLQLNYALGLQQIAVPGGIEYKWDDGSPFDYEPFWKSKYWEANYTLSLFIHNDIPIKWHNGHDGKLFSEPVAVICMQSYPSIPKTSRNISNCNSPHKHKHDKVAIFDEKWCYFLISGATRMANKGKLIDKYFNPGIAREICQNESATLPTIPTPEEQEFIQKRFPNKLFNLEPPCTEPICRWIEPKETLRIMLDLKQMRNVTDYQWVDNSPFSYKPRRWREKYNDYAFYTAMNLLRSDQIWTNYEYESEHNREPIGVLCKQPHFPEPDSTEVTTTEPQTDAPPSSTPESETEPEPESSTPEPPSPPPLPQLSSLPREANKCLPENSHHYTKVAQSGKHFCYFVVPELKEHVNRYKEDQGYKFYTPGVDHVCGNHGGQRPILWDKEDQFILDNFKEFEGVALGLMGEGDAGGMRVKWTDGAELAYFEPGHWMTELDKFDYAVMYRSESGGIKWRPGEAYESSPVGVVCQQVISGGNRLIKPTLIFSMAMVFLMM